MVRRSRLEIFFDVLAIIARGVSKPTRIMYKTNLSWTSMQTTRPAGPTSLARGNVKKPMAGPTSSTRMPGARWGVRILLGFCQSDLSGLARR